MAADEEAAVSVPPVPDDRNTPSNDEREDRFSVLVPPLSDTIVRVAAALVGVDEAEDAAQEAILRAWQAWPTLRDTGAVRTWILQITVNVCRAWQRGHFGTHRRRASLLPATSDSLPAALQDSGPGATHHAAELDLHEALGQLPEEMRTIVTLRYFGGLDASEIGAALGTPPATVRTRLRRALGLLRAQLGSSDDLPASARSTEAAVRGRTTTYKDARPASNGGGSSGPQGDSHA